MNRGWIGVDLDGTLAIYNGWNGTDDIGKPVEAMVHRVKGWLRNGTNVKIMTARVASNHSPEERENATRVIKKWCVEHIGKELEVTAEKDFCMIELWDDRCVRVEHNTGRVLSYV